MLRYLLALIVVLNMPVCYAEESDNRSREDTRTYHLYNDIDLISTLKFSYGRPRITVKSVFPQLHTPSEYDGVGNFNRLVLKIVDEEIEGFKTKVSRFQMPEGTKKLNNFYIDYSTSFIRSRKHHITSIRFSMQGKIIGTKQTNRYHRVLNYDLDSESVINLQDLFKPGSNYLELIADYVQQRLAKRLPNEKIIKSGALPLEENFRNWNIKPNGILFTFDQYQVAPAIYGTQTVLVPYSILEDVLSPDSSIYYCVKNKKTCARSNLLTGGFIDEARVNFKHRTFNPIFGRL